MQRTVSDLKELGSTTQQRLLRVRFAETKQLLLSAVVILLDKRRCFCRTEQRRCCSSSVPMTSPRKCPSTSRFACRRNRTSKFSIEQRFEKCSATKGSRKLSWKTQKQESAGRSKRRQYFQ